MGDLEDEHTRRLGESISLPFSIQCVAYWKRDNKSTFGSSSSLTTRQSTNPTLSLKTCFYLYQIISFTHAPSSLLYYQHNYKQDSQSISSGD